MTAKSPKKVLLAEVKVTVLNVPFGALVNWVKLLISRTFDAAKSAVTNPPDCSTEVPPNSPNLTSPVGAELLIVICCAKVLAPL